MQPPVPTLARARAPQCSKDNSVPQCADPTIKTQHRTTQRLQRSRPDAGVRALMSSNGDRKLLSTKPAVAADTATFPSCGFCRSACRAASNLN